MTSAPGLDLLARLAGWSALASAVVVLIGGLALFAFFAVGEPFGTVSDVAGLLFGLALVPPAWWLLQQKNRNRSVVLFATVVGVVGMFGLAMTHLLLIAGIIQLFSIALPFTGAIGVWFVLTGLSMRGGPIWPSWVGWTAAVAGIGLLLAVPGLWLGTTHAVPQAGYAVGIMAEIVWAVGFGAVLLRLRSNDRL